MAAVTTILDNPESVGTWNLVLDESTLKFENTTMWGALKVRGGFTEFSGDGKITDAETVSGRIDIKAASVDTGFHMRDADLRLGNFFDVDNYPDITVEVSDGKPTGGETVRLNAELTVKGVTRPLPLDVRVTALEDGGVRLKTQTNVTRKQFAIQGNMLGMVGGKTKLTADLVFRRATD